MPTTTNYGWTTPADTDLVKDGAAAIRSLGTAIDTTTYNNAQAAIAKTLIDAKGDLIVGSAADTAARLAVGTNDYVLTADSSTSTGLKWNALASGGMTTLASGSLSNQDLSLTSISGSYNELILYLDVARGSSGDYQIFLRFNANSSALYSQVRMSEVRGSYGAGDGEYKATSFVPHADAIETGEKAAIWLRIPEYSNTTANKIFFWNSVTKDNQQNNPSCSTGTGIFESTSAITGISSITNQLTGSYKLYGVK